MEKNIKENTFDMLIDCSFMAGLGSLVFLIIVHLAFGMYNLSSSIMILGLILPKIIKYYMEF